jgi:hypothetical protein
MIISNLGKEQRLLQIKPRISSLIDAANPLLDILALKSVKPTYFITQNKAKFLPMQLR